MTELYLIRHAEAEGNLYRRIHGQFESKVTSNGRKQIAALTERFREIPVDVCYSSDLLRTRTTAQAICGQKNLPLHLDPGFREVRLGVWENRPFGWMDTFEPEKMAGFNRDPVHWQVEGSESFETYTGRFLRAMTKAAEAHDGKTVAIFTHGAVLRGVMMALFPTEQAAHCDNTAVTLLRYEDGAYSMVYRNDNSHLDPAISTLARQNWWRSGEKRDLNLWFRPGLTALPGLTPPETWDTAFTAMLGLEPVGLVCLSDRGRDAGSVTYIGLLRGFRGRNLAVQLIGQAVFHFRAQGKVRLLLQDPGNNDALTALCRRLDLSRAADGTLEMDIRL